MNIKNQTDIYSIRLIGIKHYEPQPYFRYIREFSADNTLESIGDGFYTPNLFKIYIPESVTGLGASFLQGNKYITEFTVPKNVRTIGMDFMLGSYVKKVTFDGALDLVSF